MLQNANAAPKNIIDDAIALKICLDNAVATIQVNKMKYQLMKY